VKVAKNQERAAEAAYRVARPKREQRAEADDPRPALHPAPPVLTPAGPSRRLPSPQAVRWRYRLAQWVSVALGGLVAAVVIEAALANLTSRGLAPDQLFYALALPVLAVGLGVPWLVVKVLWLWKRRRHDWGP